MKITTNQFYFITYLMVLGIGLLFGTIIGMGLK